MTSTTRGFYSFLQNSPESAAKLYGARIPSLVKCCTLKLTVVQAAPPLGSPAWHKARGAPGHGKAAGHRAADRVYRQRALDSCPMVSAAPTCRTPAAPAQRQAQRPLMPKKSVRHAALSPPPFAFEQFAVVQTSQNLLQSPCYCEESRRAPESTVGRCWFELSAHPQHASPVHLQSDCAVLKDFRLMPFCYCLRWLPQEAWSALSGSSSYRYHSRCLMEDASISALEACSTAESAVSLFDVAISSLQVVRKLVCGWWASGKCPQTWVGCMRAKAEATRDKLNILKGLHVQ